VTTSNCVWGPLKTNEAMLRRADYLQQQAANRYKLARRNVSSGTISSYCFCGAHSSHSSQPLSTYVSSVNVPTQYVCMYRISHDQEERSCDHHSINKNACEAMIDCILFLTQASKLDHPQRCTDILKEAARRN
jgi:hypothetical protein